MKPHVIKLGSDGSALERRLAARASKRLVRPAATVRISENEKPAGQVRTAGLIISSCDVGDMPVICPSRQARRYHRSIG